MPTRSTPGNACFFCEVYAYEVFSIVLVFYEVFKRGLYPVVSMLCGAYACKVYACEVYAWRHVSPSRSVPRGAYACEVYAL